MLRPQLERDARTRQNRGTASLYSLARPDSANRKLDNLSVLSLPTPLKPNGCHYVDRPETQNRVALP
jgi:hypothetical protein